MPARPITFVLTLLLACCTHAKVLVITTDGSSLWAEQATTSGTTLHLHVNGKKTSLPSANVAMQIPAVVRGRNYPAAEVAANLKLVAKAQARFPRLRKQLDPIHDEWQTLQSTPANAIAAAIDSVKTNFSPADASFLDLKKAKSELAMIRYRDLKKEYAPTIDKLEAQLTETYLINASARLDKLATAPAKTIAHFRQVSALADDIVAAAPNTPQAAKATALRQTEKAAVNDQVVADASQAFNRGSSIRGYLTARAILKNWQRLLSADDPLAAAANGYVSSMIKALSRTQPQYDLRNREFPFTQQDYALLKPVQQSATTFQPQTAVDEIAFLYPTRRLPTLRAAANPPVTMRAIFKEMPPSSGELAMRLIPVGDGVEVLVPIAAPRLDGAAAQLTFTPNLQAIAGNVPPAATDRPNLLGQLVHRATAEADWQALSWYFPLQVR